MSTGTKVRYTLSNLLILIILLFFYSCKTPSILVTEEQRKGDELSNQHDYENAILAYRNSLSESRKLGVYRNLEVEADICRKISYAFSAQGSYAESLEYAHYGLSRDSMLQNQLGIIEDLREIGKIHLYMGDFKQGITFLDSVVSMSDELESSIKSTKLTSIADTYLTLSQVNSVLGNYFQSEDENIKALDIYTQLNDEIGEMECHLQMGKVTNETGRPWQAELHLKRSEKLAKKLGLNTSRHIHLLANLAEDKAEYQEAIKLRLEANDEARRSGITANIIWTSMVTGDTYASLGDAEKAESYYQEAIALQDTVGLRSEALKAAAELRTGSAGYAASYYTAIGSNVSSGLSYLKIGELMLEKRNYPFAAKHLSKATHAFEIAGSKEGMSKSYLRLAEANLYMDMTSKSYNYLKNARSSTRQAETLWEIEYILGQVDEKTGKNKKAIEAYKRSIEIIEDIRGNFTIDELKSTYINDKIKVYDRLINLLMENDNVEEAFNYSERARARAFLDLIGNKKIDIQSSENQVLADMEQDLRLQVLALTKILHQEELGSGRGLNRSALESDLIATRSKYSDLIHKLRLEAPEYASLISIDPPELEKLQAMATENQAYIVYWIGDLKSFVWVVKKDEIISKEITFKEDDLILLTNDCRDVMNRQSDFNVEDFATASNLSIQTLKDAYRALISPIEEEIADIETIGIVPHKVLHLLPFQALMNKENEFLIEKHQIFYTPSLSTIFTMRNRPKSPGSKILGMALGNLELGGFNGLPGTKTELENISKTQKNVLAMYEEESTESYFKENASDYAYIHLATHGFMDQRQPMFSFVLFNPTEEDDGYLTVNEIFEMSLNAELVVLSACQTGLGELSEGDEVVGLSRALLYAGSKNTIVSLWSVADKESAFLMSEFYKFLLEHSMTEALHMAQLETLKKYKCPLFWAPFQLIGNGNIQP